MGSYPRSCSSHWQVWCNLNYKMVRIVDSVFDPIVASKSVKIYLINPEILLTE